MFKYNEWSDLIDGSLVKPLSKTESGKILCLTQNNEEKEYSFEDFDFDKTVEQRETIKEIVKEATKEIDESDEPKSPEISDDSLYDGSETLSEEKPVEEIEDTPEGFYIKPNLAKALHLKQAIFWKDNV